MVREFNYILYPARGHRHTSERLTGREASKRLHTSSSTYRSLLNPLLKALSEVWQFARGSAFFKGWAECPGSTVRHCSTFLAPSYGTCDFVANDLSRLWRLDRHRLATAGLKCLPWLFGNHLMMALGHCEHFCSGPTLCGSLGWLLSRSGDGDGEG